MCNTALCARRLIKHHSMRPTAVQKDTAARKININIRNICNVGCRNTCASLPASRFAWRFCCRGNAEHHWGLVGLLPPSGRKAWSDFLCTVLLNSMCVTMAVKTLEFVLVLIILYVFILNNSICDEAGRSSGPSGPPSSAALDGAAVTWRDKTSRVWQKPIRRRISPVKRLSVCVWQDQRGVCFTQSEV